MSKTTKQSTIKKPKLTLKQQEFVKKALKYRNLTKASQEVYNLGSKGGKSHYKTARSIGSENLTKPNIQLSIQQELELMNIDRKAIMKRFKDLLYSKDQRVVYQMIDMFWKLTGGYAPEKKMLLEKSEIYQEIRKLPEESGPKKEEKEV